MQKKIVADDEPFTEVETHFADAKFYLKNHVLKEVKDGDTMPKTNIIKKTDVAIGKAKIVVERDEAFSNTGKVPNTSGASSSKRVTTTLRYVPKANTIKVQPSEL